MTDYPLDPPPGLGPPLPPPEDPPEGTTATKREAKDQVAERTVRQRLPETHREPRALSPPEVDERPTTKQARKVCALLQGDTTLTSIPTIVTKKGQAIDLAVNEETTQLDEPILVDMFHYGHLDEKKLKVGLQKEMEAMRNFDVYTEVDKDSLSPETLQGAIDTRFECKNKDDEARARLVVKDYWREVSDKDDIYASTPLLLTVKLLLLIALQFGF